MTGAVVTPAGVAAAALSGAGATGADSPDAWVLVGPPEPAAVTLLRQVEIPAAPQALTQSPETKPVKAEPKPTKAGSAAASSGVKIDLNTATQAQLESLPLVGPSMAKRIIEYRAANGPFKSVADLDNVKGIGEKTLAKLMPLVTVGDAGGAGSR
jgi:competence protein ComEA